MTARTLRRAASDAPRRDWRGPCATPLTLGAWRNYIATDMEKEGGIVEARTASIGWDDAVRGAPPGAGGLDAGPVGRTLAHLRGRGPRGTGKAWNPRVQRSSCAQWPCSSVVLTLAPSPTPIVEGSVVVMLRLRANLYIRPRGGARLLGRLRR